MKDYVSIRHAFWGFSSERKRLMFFLNRKFKCFIFWILKGIANSFELFKIIYCILTRFSVTF